MRAPVTPAALIEFALDQARELVAQAWAPHLAKAIEAVELQPFGQTLWLFAGEAAACGPRDQRSAEPVNPERWARARAAYAAAILAAHLQTLNQLHPEPPPSPPSTGGRRSEGTWCATCLHREKPDTNPDCARCYADPDQDSFPGWTPRVDR